MRVLPGNLGFALGGRANVAAPAEVLDAAIKGCCDGTSLSLLLLAGERLHDHWVRRLEKLPWRLAVGAHHCLPGHALQWVFDGGHVKANVRRRMEHID